MRPFHLHTYKNTSETNNAFTFVDENLTFETLNTPTSAVVASGTVSSNVFNYDFVNTEMSRLYQLSKGMHVTIFLYPVITES